MVSATTWLMITFSVILVLALSLLMYDRVLAEVLDVGDEVQTSTAGSLALAFAVLSAIANLAVVAVHTFDGSPESELHRDLGRLLRRRQRAVHRRQRAAMTVLDHRSDQAAAQGRTADEGNVAAS